MFGVLRSSARTGGVGNPEMTDVERRLEGLINYGTVVAVDYADTAKPRVRVKIGDPDDEDGHLTTAWLPLFGRRAGGDSEWDPHEIGEAVVVLAAGGELQNGLVMPIGLFTTAHPAAGDRVGLWRKKFQDGAVLEYDRATGAMKFEAITSLKLKVGSSTLTITAAGLAFSGPVTGDSTAVFTGNVTGQGTSLHGHTHTDPQGGATGAPV
jgi:phage baseplate assembly protein V